MRLTMWLSGQVVQFKPRVVPAATVAYNGAEKSMVNPTDSFRLRLHTGGRADYSTLGPAVALDTAVR